MWWLWLFTLAGCQVVFPLETVDAPKACDPMDTAVYPIQLPTRISGYREGREPLRWSEAEAACEADGVGAHLFSPFDLSELGDFQRFPNVPPPIGGSWWVGVSREAGTTLDDFVSVLGDPVPMSSPMWEVNEPNGPGELVVRFESMRNLFDAPDNIQLDYVCECDGRIPVAR